MTNMYLPTSFTFLNPEYLPAGLLYLGEVFDVICLVVSVLSGQQEDGAADDKPVHRQGDGEAEGGGHRFL